MSKTSSQVFNAQVGRQVCESDNQLNKETPRVDEHVENQALQLACESARKFLSMHMLSIKMHCLPELVGAVLT